MLNSVKRINVKQSNNSYVIAYIVEELREIFNIKLYD